jgi:hypothetical protein
VQAVPKFELSEEAYQTRDNFRKWKAQSSPKKSVVAVAVGDRVRIQVTNAAPRVGTVRFVGATEFSPGMWVSVLVCDWRVVVLLLFACLSVFISLRLGRWSFV